MMKRTSVNPVDWGLAYEMDQGEVVEGATRHLRCSGQISVEPDASAELGLSIVAPGDMRGQIAQVLANIDSVLDLGSMSKADIVGMRFYTTDVDSFLENYDVYATWIAPTGIRPPQTLLGIQRLAFPELMIEIEVEAQT